MSSDPSSRPHRKPVPVPSVSYSPSPSDLSATLEPAQPRFSESASSNTLNPPPFRTHHSTSSAPSFDTNTPTTIQQHPNAKPPHRRTSSLTSLLRHRPANPRSPSPPPAAPVEARSLASLLHLAAHPPLTPPTPAASFASHAGTILWILRVPNSADLIATPLAPTRRLAGRAEISACIYYYHAAAGTVIRRDPEGGQEDVFIATRQREGEVELEGLTEGYKKLSQAGEFRRMMKLERGEGGWLRRGKAPALMKRKGKGYVFVAPWGDGVWEFQKEAAGRYLKFKHYAGGAEKGVLLSVVEFQGLGGHSIGAHRRSLSDGEDGSMGMLVLHPTGMEAMDLCMAANFVVIAERWGKWEKERKAVGQ